jgi:dihydroorotate dehydrogenase electron transfer subunit
MAPETTTEAARSDAPGTIRVVGRVERAEAPALVLRVPGWPGHRPGQFAMLQLDPTGTRLDPLLPRPMAVYRAEGDRVEFRFKVVGRGTRILSELEPEAPVGFLGPLGTAFPEPEGTPVLVGGGTGIASLYGLAVWLGSGVRVLLGGRTQEDLLGLDDFEALPVRLSVTTEDGSRGQRGVVTDLLEIDREHEVFACGPAAMLHRVYARARAVGARCWVSLENTMACGFGICLGCAIPTDAGYRYVCTDGPVFAGETVDWDGLP